jgi:hypothetical protein
MYRRPPVVYQHPVYHAIPDGSLPPSNRIVNPYLKSRGISHSRYMLNPNALPGDLPPRTLPPRTESPRLGPPRTQARAPFAALVTAPRPSQPVWHVQRRVRVQEAESQEVFQEHSPWLTPRNLEQEHRFQRGFQLGIPMYEEPHVPDLDYGQWHRDADSSLDKLGRLSYDFGSLAGNSFKPTEEESQVLVESSTLHEKKVLKAHEQFIRMLRSHKVTEAFANYDGTYDYQFYRIFQGDKTPAKRNAMNNIFGLWAKLFYHRLDGKPYQPSGFMVTLHSLFGELARRGVTYSVSKDFNYRGGFIRSLEQRWNEEKKTDVTFATRPTKFKMPEDYSKNIQAAVSDGLLDPLNDVQDCQLLFACVCGTMFGFRGNQVNGGLLIYFLCAAK